MDEEETVSLSFDSGFLLKDKLHLELRSAANGVARVELVFVPRTVAERSWLWSDVLSDVLAFRYRTVRCDWGKWRQQQQCEERLKRELTAKSEADSKHTGDVEFGPKDNYNCYRTLPSADSSEVGEDSAVAWRTLDFSGKLHCDYASRKFLTVRFNAAIPRFAGDYSVIQMQLWTKSTTHKLKCMWVTDVLEFPLPFEVQPRDERMYLKGERVQFRPFALGALAVPKSTRRRLSAAELRALQKSLLKAFVDGVVKEFEFDESLMAYVYTIHVPQHIKERHERARGVVLESEYTFVNETRKSHFFRPPLACSCSYVDLRDDYENARAVTALHGLYSEWPAVAYLEICKSPLAECKWYTGERAKCRNMSLKAFALLIVEYCTAASFQFTVGCPLCFNPQTSAHEVDSGTDVISDKRLRPYLCRRMPWTTWTQRNEGTTYCDSCFMAMDFFDVSHFCVGESEHLTHDFCTDCVYRSVSRFQSVYASIEHILSNDFDMNLDCIREIVGFVVVVVVVIRGDNTLKTQPLKGMRKRKLGAVGDVPAIEPFEDKGNVSSETETMNPPTKRRK